MNSLKDKNDGMDKAQTQLEKNFDSYKEDTDKLIKESTFLLFLIHE